MVSNQLFKPSHSHTKTNTHTHILSRGVYVGYRLDAVFVGAAAYGPSRAADAECGPVNAVRTARNNPADEERQSSQIEKEASCMGSLSLYERVLHQEPKTTPKLRTAAIDILNLTQ